MTQQLVRFILVGPRRLGAPEMTRLGKVLDPDPDIRISRNKI